MFRVTIGGRHRWLTGLLGISLLAAVFVTIPMADAAPIIQVTTVASTTDMIHPSDLALDSAEQPHIAYFDSATGKLMYASLDGSSWTTQVVATENVSDLSLVIDSNDAPHIAFRDATTGQLMHTVRSGASSWFTVMVNDGTGSLDTGVSPSLAIDASDVPHISYYDRANNKQMYIVFSGPTPFVSVVDASGGGFSSLILDPEGNPTIGYSPTGTTDLDLAFLDKTGWNNRTVEQVNSPKFAMFGAAGEVGFFYDDLTTKSLMGVATNIGGGFAVPFTQPGDEPDDISVSIMGSSGTLGFSNQTHTLVRVITQSTSITPITVASGTAIGYDVSVAADSAGTLHLSYYDDLNGELKYATVIDDSAAPVTTATATIPGPAPYAFGSWTNQPVTVTLNANDTGSGIATTFYTIDSAQQTYDQPFTISSEGLHTITYWSTDAAGNIEESQQQNINIDLTPPVTTASASIAGPAPYTFGNWTNQPVTVTLSADDSGGSNVADTFYTIDNGAQQPYNQPFTINTEADHTITYWSTDNASNTESIQTVHVKIDLTAPTINGAPSAPPTGNGWYNSPVTIHWICSDALSGVATCPTDQKISTEGTDQSIDGSATDNAGNMATTASSPGVNIDVGPPTTTATATIPGPAPYSFGSWTNQPVTVTLNANDTGSGVATTFYTIDGAQQTYDQPFTISSEADHIVTFWSTDNAENVETSQTVHVKIDLTAPTLSGAPRIAPNGNGWYNQAVTIHWTCNDALSGIASCQADQTISTEGMSQTVNGNATDNAGNMATSASDPGVNIDFTNPTVTYSGNQSTYTVDEMINIICTAIDNLSGIATTDCANISGSAAGFAVGPNTFSSSATDEAGNTGAGSVSFTVGVDPDSLCNLTKRYVGNARVGGNLCAPLGLVKLAGRTHNERMKTAAIDTYTMLVNTQRGRSLTNVEAETLIALAQSL